MHGKLTAVIETAKEVGQIVLPYFSNVTPDVKRDGSWITKADHEAHDYLSEHLRSIVDSPVLSEELDQIQQQQIIENSSQSFWCIDPIDGTSNFTLGVPYWCISIALVIDGTVELAVVYDPNRDETFAAEGNEPSHLNGVPMKRGFIDSLYNSTAIIDLKRIPANMVRDLCAKPPYRSQRSLGASALEMAWVACDRCQLYLHGGQHLWDHAAAIKILQNAGGAATNFDGDEMLATNLQPQSIIAASSVSLYQEWHQYLSRFD